MKTTINRTQLAVLVTSLGMVGFLPIHVKAEPSPDLVGSVLRSSAQAAKVPKGESVAMVCAKCQTVLLSKSNTKQGFLGWFKPKIKHECAGCGGEFSMKDVPAGQGGKVSVSEFVHTCSKCGDESAFCCATTIGGGPTKRMEKGAK
jgi:hypothetical protein